MSQDVGGDQLAIIRIEGMHCHKCEVTIQKSLNRHPGVHEVEVDFNSGQASILFDRDQVEVETLIEAIQDAGYRTMGYSQGNSSAHGNSSPAGQP